MKLQISFNTHQKRLCKLTQEDKELLKKYNKMEDLPTEHYNEEYPYVDLTPRCKNCEIEIKLTWTFCPSCGNDLPVTESNKNNECED